MTKGKRKGNDYERSVCRILSKWWTKGRRDDVFWRTASSGGMATQRSYQGKETFGQAGDIQATHPIGQQLIDMCAIEVKRGYSKNSIFELGETDRYSEKNVYEKFIKQVEKDRKKSGAPFWLLISKRDRKEPIIIMPLSFFKELNAYESLVNTIYPEIIYKIKRKDGMVRSLFITSLSSFLKNVKPIYIKNIADAYSKKHNQ
jgi:hypothetical protein